VISGNCRIGRKSFLGVNCTVQDGVTIGEACFVGPRSLVRQDLRSESVLVDTATKVQGISSRNLRF
jgi:acetyltransferase-like isoleucine patch superfamily enzyme